MSKTLQTLLIGVTLLFLSVGAYFFMQRPSDHRYTTNDFFLFAPFGLALALHLTLASFDAVGTMIRTNGLQVLLVIIAITSGIVCFALGVMVAETPQVQSALFSFSGGLVGFGFGIPVGEYFKSVSKSREDK